MLLWGALEEDSGDGFSGLGGFVAVGTQACEARRKTHRHTDAHMSVRVSNTLQPHFPDMKILR